MGWKNMIILLLCAMTLLAIAHVAHVDWPDVDDRDDDHDWDDKYGRDADMKTPEHVRGLYPAKSLDFTSNPRTH